MASYGHGSNAMELQTLKRAQHVLFQFGSVLTRHTDFFDCDKYGFEENNFVLASQGLDADRRESFLFLESSVQQEAFLQIEASHFPLCKFQGASHSTEVRYITNSNNNNNNNHNNNPPFRAILQTVIF